MVLLICRGTRPRVPLHYCHIDNLNRCHSTPTKHLLQTQFKFRETPASPVNTGRECHRTDDGQRRISSRNEFAKYEHCRCEHADSAKHVEMKQEPYNKLSYATSNHFIASKRTAVQHPREIPEPLARIHSLVMSMKELTFGRERTHYSHCIALLSMLVICQ